jgi:hypothetical protein
MSSVFPSFNNPSVPGSADAILEYVRALLMRLPRATPDLVEECITATPDLVEECITAALAHKGNFDVTTMDGLDPITHSSPDGPIPRRDEVDTNHMGDMAKAIADKTKTVSPLLFLLTVAKACAPASPVPASEASASAGGEPTLTEFEGRLIEHLKGVNKGAQFLRKNEHGDHIWNLYFGPIMRVAGEFDNIDCGYFTIVAGIHFVNKTPAAGWHSCTDLLRKIRIDSLAATLAVEIKFMLGLGTKPHKGSGKPTAAATPRTEVRMPHPRTIANAAGGIKTTKSHKGADKAVSAQAPAPARPTKECEFFKKGLCRFGDQCKSLHIRPDAAAAAAGGSA